MDIFKLLHDEHERVQELMEKIESCERMGERNEHLRLFSQFKDEIIKHSKAEDKAFYSQLEDDEELRDLIMEARAEHALVENLIFEIEQLEGASKEEWMMKFRMLKENVEHHINEEEEQIFDKAQEIIDRDEADDMARLMKHHEAGFKEDAARQEMQRF